MTRDDCERIVSKSTVLFDFYKSDPDVLDSIDAFGMHVALRAAVEALEWAVRVMDGDEPDDGTHKPAPYNTIKYAALELKEKP